MKKTIAEMEQTAASEAANKLISLFDEDSFVELGKFVGANGEKTGVVSGYGYVDGAVVYAYAQDTSVNAGAVNTAAALKIKKVYELALKNGAPVIGIFDSKGGDIKEGMKTLGAYGEIAKMSAALSGAVPQIAVVDGLCAGTAAMIACMADVVIMTEKSELFMTAPFTADDKTAGAGTAENAATSGVAAILAKDSDEAIAKAKQLLSVLPANNLETAGNDYYMENDAAVSADLKGIELINSVADKESVIELYKQFGTSSVTEAFGIRQVAAGGFGAVLMNGVKRGLFSNEAGSGSAPCAAAAAECDTPVKAGLTQALGVFIDTIVICSCTAMIMLTAPENIVAGKEGMDLLQSAMRYHLGDFGVIFIAVTLFLFSFSTFLGILFYARSNVAYLFGDNWISQTMYKVLALVMLFVGGIAAYTFVWDLGDVGIGLMTIFNTGILYLMGGQAIKELRVFEESNKAQSNSQCSQQGDNVTQ